MAGEHEQAEAALTNRDHEVRGHDHLLRRDPVRDHPAGQREHQRREDLRGQHVGQVGGGAGHVQDRERHPDQGERGSRRRQHPVCEQQPEVADREHGKPADQARPQHCRRPFCACPAHVVSAAGRGRNRPRR
jgi:hypothetical protein